MNGSGAGDRPASSRIPPQTPQRIDERTHAFYRAWAEMLAWAEAFANEHDGVLFVKQADFPDYIYRMERPYDLPTIVMSASLSKAADRRPVLMMNASPRHAVFKEVVVHPFESHVHRRLTLAPDGAQLAEGRRPFTRERFEALARSLFAHRSGAT
jgi:hypothetical protein